MFQSDYAKRLIELGEADAAARIPEIARFLSPITSGSPGSAAPQPSSS